MRALFLYSMGYGGYGYSDTGASGGGFFSSISALLAGMPGWLATLIVAAAVLGLGALCGYIGGRVIGGIFYPDPEKPSVLSKQHKLIMLGGFVAVFALVVFSFNYTPKPKDPMPPDGMEDTLPEGENPDIGFEGGEFDGEDGELDGESDAESEKTEQDDQALPNPSTSTGGTKTNPGVAISPRRSGGGVAVAIRG